MNQKTTFKLEMLANRLHGYSALAGVLHDAVDKLGRENEDAETAHIEIVLRHLGYDLEEQAEKLEKIIAESQEAAK